MSILLDSLRKSEAQRKSKDAPSIHSVPVHRTGPSRTSHWLPMLMIGLTAIAIGWIVWEQYDVVDRPKAAVVSAEAPASEAGEANAPLEEIGDQAAPAQSAPRSPVESLAEEREADAPGAELESEVSPLQQIAEYGGEEETEPLFDEGGERREEAIEEPAEEDLTDEADALASESALPENDPMRDLVREQRAAPQSRSRPEPGGSEPRSYWQLPQTWRTEMPEFKISVLVYAESAEDRFILMNGERLLEGDEVEGGVVLEEIRRDGAIFSFRSQRFLVKS